jgi:hypothetical protein
LHRSLFSLKDFPDQELLGCLSDTNGSQSLSPSFEAREGFMSDYDLSQSNTFLSKDGSEISRNDHIQAQDFILQELEFNPLARAMKEIALKRTLSDMNCLVMYADRQKKSFGSYLYVGSLWPFEFIVHEFDQHEKYFQTTKKEHIYGTGLYTHPSNIEHVEKEDSSGVDSDILLTMRPEKIDRKIHKGMKISPRIFHCYEPDENGNTLKEIVEFYDPDNVFETHTKKLYLRDFYLENFSEKESWGWWSDANISRKPSLFFKVPDRVTPLKDYDCFINIPNVFLPKDESEILIKIFLNERYVKDYALNAKNRPYQLKIPLELLGDKKTDSLNIQLDITGSSSPQEHGMSDDPRRLAIGINSLFFRKNIFTIPSEILLQDLTQARKCVLQDMQDQFEPYKEQGITKGPEFERTHDYLRIQIINNIIYGKKPLTYTYECYKELAFDPLVHALKEIALKRTLPDVDFLVTYAGSQYKTFGSCYYSRGGFLWPFEFIVHGLDQYEKDFQEPIDFNKKKEQVYFRGLHTNVPLIENVERGNNQRGTSAILSAMYPEKIDSKINKGVKSFAPTAHYDNPYQKFIDGYCKVEDYDSIEKINTYKYVLSLDGWLVEEQKNGRFLQGLIYKSVVVAASQHHSFFRMGARPWVHYVPVQSDLSDLFEKYHWLRTHNDEAEIIATNGYNFAKECFGSQEKVIDYIVYMLEQYASLQKFVPEATLPAL